MPTDHKNIRVLALAIVEHDGRMLVMPGYDKNKDEHFFRLIGGGVEFGETSLEALRREWLEELNAELDDCRLLRVVENIFNYEGSLAQEVCFVYKARLKDESLYAREKMPTLDEPGVYSCWETINPENIRKIKPEGLEDLFND